jgi:hypothetical protein
MIYQVCTFPWKSAGACLPLYKENSANSGSLAADRKERNLIAVWINSNFEKCEAAQNLNQI